MRQGGYAGMNPLTYLVLHPGLPTLEILLEKKRKHPKIEILVRVRVSCRLVPWGGAGRRATGPTSLWTVPSCASHPAMGPAFERVSLILALPLVREFANFFAI